jgi:hypothetical protein
MSAESAIRAYGHAFTQRDLTATVELFTDDGLYEMPLLGQRLAGRSEAFRVLQWCAIDILAIQHTGTVAIAEARLTAKLHRDPEPASFPMAMVLESAESRVARLSIYLNTNTGRLWFDSPVLAKPRL